MTQTRVAAIQLPFTYVRNPHEFGELVRAPLERAAEAGAKLIVLPHYLSFALFGMFEPDARPDNSLDELSRRQGAPSTHEWLLDRAGYIFEFYIHSFQSLAERVDAWVVPGTTLELIGDTLYSTALVFDSAGQVVGRQLQLHPSSEEQGWGIARGQELRVFNTEIGDLGIVIGNDVRFPEVSHSLAAQGAGILVHPGATHLKDDPMTFDFAQQVQASRVFGIQANLCGGEYRGRSAILAPVEHTNDKSGIIAIAPSESEGAIIVADLDFELLQEPPSTEKV